jgi:hypothetical protein
MPVVDRLHLPDVTPAAWSAPGRLGTIFSRCCRQVSSGAGDDRPGCRDTFSARRAVSWDALSAMAPGPYPTAFGQGWPRLRVRAGKAGAAVHAGPHRGSRRVAAHGVTLVVFPAFASSRWSCRKSSRNPRIFHRNPSSKRRDPGARSSNGHWRPSGGSHEISDQCHHLCARSCLRRRR